MTLRILHVLDHSLPLHSGYTFRTASILKQQRAQGWETFHLTTPKQGPSKGGRDSADGWTFYRTSNQGDEGLIEQMRLTARRLEEVIADVRPEILHVHSPVLNALPTLRVGKRHGIPVVYEVRAFWEDAAVDHGTTTEGSLRYRLTRALETYALRRADQVTTICEGLRQDIAARGIRADRITVIPNAVDVDSFPISQGADPELQSRFGLTGKTVIGFAGSFYGYEGLGLLVAAIAGLLPKRPELRLLLVGGGPQEENLKAQVEQLGIADKVIFTGRVPHAEVQRYYDMIDVLAYPRLPMRLTELVTPLKPLEAMAQGLMFVASDVGGHKELVRHGETGFLFRAGSEDALAAAIDEVLNKRQMWPKIRQQARYFVEVERTWQGSVMRYREVYGRALASKGRSVSL
jgi:PEP-CTERM/exosortase A-associated glycosyltransferase